MEEKLAIAIVREAANRGFPIKQGSSNEKAAEIIVTQAKEAYQSGARGEDVMVILNMAEETPKSSSGSGESKPRTSFMDAVIESSRAGRRLIEKENLPIPPDLKGDPPELPRDLSKLSDDKLQALHSEFNAARARVIWLVSVKEDDMDSARVLHEYHEQQEMDRLKAIPGNEKRTAASLKAEAKKDDTVAEWAAKKRQHATEVRDLKALRDIYDYSWQTISRQWTMRAKEREE